MFEWACITAGLWKARTTGRVVVPYGRLVNRTLAYPFTAPKWESICLHCSKSRSSTEYNKLVSSTIPVALKRESNTNVKAGSLDSGEISDHEKGKQSTKGVKISTEAVNRLKWGLEAMETMENKGRA